MGSGEANKKGSCLAYVEFIREEVIASDNVGEDDHDEPVEVLELSRLESYSVKRKEWD
jgi:hypothetical protein